MHEHHSLEMTYHKNEILSLQHVHDYTESAISALHTCSSVANMHSVRHISDDDDDDDDNNNSSSNNNNNNNNNTSTWLTGRRHLATCRHQTPYRSSNRFGTSQVF